MIDSSNGMSQGQEESSLPGTSDAPVHAQAAPVTNPPEERVFKQSEVNDIVKKAKYGALEDFKRIQQTQPQYAQQKIAESAPITAPSQFSAQPNENEIRRLAAEETQRLRDEWMQEARTKQEAEYAQKVVGQFWEKVAPGKEKYQDFEKVTGDIQYAKFPNVVQLLAEYVDNSGDVLYNLGQDRIKMANLEQLALMSPQDAIVQARRLAQSLKDNETASKTKIPNEPLSQMRPSNTGTDNGVMSVGDYRKKYKV